MKTRTPIPEQTAAAVLFASDRTCCVCHEPGKPTQLHHIDEDPSNNEESNLSVLCLLCHDDTQVRGGFGRKLNATLVRQYRDDWCERIHKRRERADEIAISAVAGGIAAASGFGEAEERPAPALLDPYIASLPVALGRAYENSRPLWYAGAKVSVLQGTSDVIDVVTQLLVHLAAWYPPNHFGAKSAREYFSGFIATRAMWHRAVAERDGVGTGGSVVSWIVGRRVLTDLELAVVDLVFGLMGLGARSSDVDEWKKAWENAKQDPWAQAT
jgi:hypothetical protein